MPNIKSKINNHKRNTIQESTPQTNLCNLCAKRNMLYELTLPNKEYNIQRKHKMWCH